MHQGDTLNLLKQHRAFDAVEQAFLDQTLAFVAREASYWQRSTLEGHLTGSAWIVTPEGDKALLLHHAKLNRWLQPGGHADQTDQNFLMTAQREAMEECGLDVLQAFTEALFDVDIHQIPERGAEPLHLHYDLRFIFILSGHALLRRNLLETKDLAWVEIDALCTAETPESLRRMAEKTRNLFK